MLLTKGQMRNSRTTTSLSARLMLRIVFLVFVGVLGVRASSTRLASNPYFDLTGSSWYISLLACVFQHYLQRCFQHHIGGWGTELFVLDLGLGRNFFAKKACITWRSCFPLTFFTSPGVFHSPTTKERVDWSYFLHCIWCLLFHHHLYCTILSS
jgi:hypothetical protein